MARIRTMSSRLPLFFLLAYLLSWCIWVPLALTGRSDQWLLWLAGSAPTIAAVALSAIHGGRAGLRRLARLRPRTRPRWYAVSLLGPPLTMLAALGLHVVLGGDRPRFGDPAHLVTSVGQVPLVGVVFLYVLVFTAVGEEFGWRGYAQPRLQARLSPFASSLVLGPVWALWHLPLFWMAGDFHQQLPVGWFLLQVAGSTFLYTWMFNRTGGSLMIALLFHTSSNASVGLLPVLPLDNGGSSRPLWLVVVLLWAVVGLVLWADRRIFFAGSRERPGSPAQLAV
jgi:uncharacterized protein